MSDGAPGTSRDTVSSSATSRDSAPSSASSSTDSSSSSGVIKHSKGKPLTKEEKILILNVRAKLISENYGKTQINLINQIRDLTGIGCKSIKQVIKEFDEKGTVQANKLIRKHNQQIFHKLDDFTKIGIRRKVHQFFRENIQPTLSLIWTAVNDDESLPNFTRSTFHRILKKLQFRFKGRGRDSAFSERSDLIIWRRNFIRSIRKFRSEGRKIFYTDETWLNCGHVRNKIWVDETIKNARQAVLEGLTTGLKDPSGKGKRLIITHIGSVDGFLPNGLLCFESKKTGDYHEDMNGEVYEEWFAKILLQMQPGNVIVIDNAPYHSVKVEKIPNTSTRKQEIIDWLTSKNICVGKSMLRVELLQEVQKVRHLYDRYKIDEMAKEKGVILLRLPPYHCEMNAIELIWAQVKGHVAKENRTYKLGEIRDLLLEGINKITAANWEKAISHAIKQENELWELDNKIDENSQEEIIITFSDEDEDDDFDELFGDE